MLPPIYQTLNGNAAVAAIVADRIYRHDSAPQDTTRPYVTWSLAGGAPDPNLCGTPDIDRLIVQLDCWHQTDAGVVTLAESVRAAIEPHATVTGYPINLREPETKLYRIALQCDWFLGRP